MKQSFQKNIFLLGCTEFFSFFGITSFWLLFLSQQGMSLWQIGLLESLFHLTSLLSEVPSGVLADRFSYKSNLFLGRMASIFSALLLIFAHDNFYMYALGMIFSAWSYNFDSGTSQALLYQTAKDANQESRYLKLTSILNAILEASRTIGMVLAAFFVHVRLIYTYYIQIILSTIAIACIFYLKEPTTTKEPTQNQNSWQILQMVYLFFREQPKLFTQLLMVQLTLTLISMYYFYYQNELPNLQSWQISGIMLLSSAVNLLAIYLANLIGQRYSNRLILSFITFCSGSLFICTFMKNSWMYALIFLLSDGLVVIFYPLFEAELQKRFVSEIRATMLSVYTMIGSLAMILLFPLIGAIIDSIGFTKCFMCLGMLLIILSLPIKQYK